ncbi:hypothetical protein [Streptomyces sp. NPDC088762]|uniref:hypothetical protein n=1 Tax=Streptomyces sp. NPDC088762 TaxID=3365891 RepID=UPI0037F1CDAC
MTTDRTCGSRAETTPVTAGSATAPGRPSRVLRALVLRWPTWLGLALVAVTFVDGAPSLKFPASLLVVMPVCYLAFGALRGELRRPGVLPVQAAALAAFAALALVSFTVDRTAGLYVVAGGWLLHAAWDFAHHRVGRVVPRAWSEWCGVVDLFGAVAILLTA